MTKDMHAGVWQAGAPIGFANGLPNDALRLDVHGRFERMYSAMAALVTWGNGRRSTRRDFALQVRERRDTRANSHRHQKTYSGEQSFDATQFCDWQGACLKRRPAGVVQPSRTIQKRINLASGTSCRAHHPDERCRSRPSPFPIAHQP